MCIICVCVLYYLSAYARQPARGPTMWAHFVAILAYVGLSCGQCGPMLWLCWPHVDSCWAERSEKWAQQRSTVKRRIFWWSVAYLGAMLAHLGAMLAYLEGNVAHLGAMLAHLGAMLAQLGAMLAHLGAMLAHLGAMLAHLEAYVGPAWGLCWPMLTHLRPLAPGNAAKMRRAQNTVKRGGFWPYRLSCGRGRGPSLLRRGEKRPRLCHG